MKNENVNHLNDYIKWRGDLSFKTAPLNIVDIMLLTQATYYPWEGLVSADFKKPVNLTDVIGRINWDPQPPTTTEDDEVMAALVADSRRYSEVGISGFANEVDQEAGYQFSAVTYRIRRNLHIVAFRGTDATLVGWKENMDLAYEDQVPAQALAVKYLEATAAALRGTLIVTGHSKGGNLAVYASAFASEKTTRRIQQVYNFDGPGFNAAVIKKEEFVSILGRVQTYVPQDSMFGLLLEHSEPYTVVASAAKGGLMQHFLHSWQVEREGLCLRDKLSDVGELTHAALSEWINSMSYEQKREFIKTIFSLMQKENYTTIYDLTSPSSLLKILRDYRELDKADRKAVSKVIAALTGSVAENIKGKITEATKSRRLVKKNN